MTFHYWLRHEIAVIMFCLFNFPSVDQDWVLFLVNLVSGSFHDHVLPCIVFLTDDVYNETCVVHSLQSFNLVYCPSVYNMIRIYKEPNALLLKYPTLTHRSCPKIIKSSSCACTTKPINLLILYSIFHKSIHYLLKKRAKYNVSDK